MEVFLWILGILFVAFAALGIYGSNQNKAKKQSTFDLLIAEGKGSSRYTFVSPDGQSGMSLSGDGKTILLYRYFRVIALNKSDIIGAEAVKDGSTITKTNRGSQVGGALVGAALLGPVGLLLGGVTGSKRCEETIRSLKIRILTRGEHAPYIDIDFISALSPQPAHQHADQIRKAEDALSTIKSVIG